MQVITPLESPSVYCVSRRPSDTETTALGAAYLAGLATGFFRGLDEVEQFWKAEGVFEPAMKRDHREELYAGWKVAVSRCRYAP